MSRIIFAADFEEGHLLAILGLGKELRERGHEVIYAGFADCEEMVRERGFVFVPLLEDRFPAGSKHYIRRNSLLEQVRDEFLADLTRGDNFQNTVARLEPDLVILLHYMSIEGLVLRIRFGLRVAYARPSIFERSRHEMVREECWKSIESTRCAQELLLLFSEARLSVQTFDDLVKAVMSFPEMNFDPEFFELPEYLGDPNVYYIGSSIDMSRVEAEFPWAAIRLDRPLILCTLGSQCDLRPDVSRRFFETVLGTAARHDEWSIIVSLGRGLCASDFKAPPNVYLANWVPQMAILSRAALMITHGGPGTVRECIHMRVPMLVCPLMRDQFAAGERIRRFHLGDVLEIETLTPERLSECLSSALGNTAIRTNMDRMAKRFREHQSQGLGAKAVHAILYGYGQEYLRGAEPLRRGSLA